MHWYQVLRKETISWCIFKKGVYVKKEDTFKRLADTWWKPAKPEVDPLTLRANHDYRDPTKSDRWASDYGVGFTPSIEIYYTTHMSDQPSIALPKPTEVRNLEWMRSDMEFTAFFAVTQRRDTPEAGISIVDPIFKVDWTVSNVRLDRPVVTVESWRAIGGPTTTLGELEFDRPGEDGVKKDETIDVYRKTNGDWGFNPEIINADGTIKKRPATGMVNDFKKQTIIPSGR